MANRIWFRSLYWRIAFGFVALLAAVLLAQTVLFLWLTNRFSRNSVNHPPAQLATTVAADMSAQLAHDPALQVESYLRSHYGRAYQPFAVALRDGRAGFEPARGRTATADWIRQASPVAGGPQPAGPGGSGAAGP